MGHSALEEERVKCSDCSGLVHDMGWNITLTGDHVVRWAIAELDAGQTSDALVKLAAIQVPTTWRDVGELFRTAYTDLGYDRSTKEQHLLMYATEIAGRVVNGSMDPIEGCAPRLVIKGVLGGDAGGSLPGVCRRSRMWLGG